MSESLKNQVVWDSFRGGSLKALEIIYDDNYAPLFHYGLKFTSDDEMIKDLIHELFVELIDSGEKLSRTNNIRFYLLKAMRYKILNQISQGINQKGDLKAILEFSLLDSIENQMIKKEVETEVQEQMILSISKLSDKQQEIIYLRFYDNLPYQEIAEIFGVKVQTVRNLMTRAIKCLKEDLEAQKISRGIIYLIVR